MTINLTMTQWGELRQQSLMQMRSAPADEPFVQSGKIVGSLGSGTYQSIELYPDVRLSIEHCTYQEDILVRHAQAQHPLQFSFKLAGMCAHSNGKQSSPDWTMISGSGIQREIVCQMFADIRTVGIEIFMSVDRLATFFPDSNGQLSDELDFLVKDRDWQTLTYAHSNLEIRRTVQQIVNCPYQGFAKRLYLQGKVHDLMALQLSSVLRDRASLTPVTSLKPQSIASIHQAKAILTDNLEYPPSLSALAQQVGVSHSTLRRGFQELFGTTVFGYLTQQRMIEAERILRDGKVTVAEVANQVGYAHLGCFAAAFKRQFGIKPSECLVGKLIEIPTV